VHSFELFSNPDAVAARVAALAGITRADAASNTETAPIAVQRPNA